MSSGPGHRRTPSGGGAAAGPAAAALGEVTDYIEAHGLQALLAEALEAAVLARAHDPVAFIEEWLRAKRAPPVATIDAGVQRQLATPSALSVGGVFSIDTKSGIFTLELVDED